MNEHEVAEYVTHVLLGKPYAETSDPDELTRFSCYGLVWHYLKVTGLVLPWDPFEAEKEFVEVKDKPRWRDILTYVPVRSTRSHLGVVESIWSVLHCSAMAGAVEREDLVLPPWSTARVMRHKSLL